MSLQIEPYFSPQSNKYVEFRPEYPASFIERIANLTQGKNLAWDCGTGNGQCARRLKNYFNQVIATDLSADQLSHATPLSGVRFHQSPAESCPTPDSSVDLVTVACAIHWFDRDRFYSEVRRVLKKEGAIAVWTYFMPQVDSGLDPIIRRYYIDLLAPYYPPQTLLYRNEYRDLDFPFRELKIAPEPIVESWSGDKLLGFMGTWSARMSCLQKGDPDPLALIYPELREAWGNLASEKKVRIPLYARVGVAES